MPAKIANNATARIAATFDITDTELTLQPGGGSRFPTVSGDEWFPVTLIKETGQQEITRCTARNGDILTLERGQEETQIQKFIPGDRAELRLTAGALHDLATEPLPEFGTAAFRNVGPMPSQVPANSDLSDAAHTSVAAIRSGVTKNMVGLANVDNVKQAPHTHIGTGGGAHSHASTVQAGFMSPADKQKLNALSLDTTITPDDMWSVAAGATDKYVQTGDFPQVSMTIPVDIARYAIYNNGSCRMYVVPLRSGRLIVKQDGTAIADRSIIQGQAELITLNLTPGTVILVQMASAANGQVTYPTMIKFTANAANILFVVPLPPK